MQQRDPATLVGLAGVWVILILVCFAGYRLTHVAGARSAATATPGAHAKSVHRKRVSPPQYLSLGQIFSVHPPSLKGYNRRQLRTIVATGDVIPARSVNYQMVTRNDFLYPFRPTAAYLRTGDITLINLESPLISYGCPVVIYGMQFCGDPRVVQGLRFAGVDVACTANNHIGNYGLQGIQETWAHLRAAGIQVCGLGQVAYHTVRGLRFAFLAYNTVGERFNYALARRQIQEARRHAAVVVVSVHWGKEYVAVPQTAPGLADDDPRHVAHWIIDSGADLIIGNHPHHVQGVELYHHRLITYAHGNFVFDQMFSIATREGVVGTYTFAGRRLIAVHYRPVYIYNYAQPRWAGAARTRAILRTMYISSRGIAGRQA